MTFKRLCVATVLALMAGVTAHANEGAALDRFPAEKLRQLPSLQNGAKLFVNYCLGCHSASQVRYNRLQDLGLTEDQIKQSLLFTGEKTGDLMTIAAKSIDQKIWFGATPPDLSLTARSRSGEAGSGLDWIYTYLRSFYRDNQRPTGWNNVTFANVGMPHVLWGLQGARTLTREEVKRVSDEKTKTEQWSKVTTTFDEYGVHVVKSEPLGEGHFHEGVTRIDWKDLDPAKSKRYDEEVSDIVAYMGWMSDPNRFPRFRLGVIVLIFLGVFTVLAWGLNRVYWKDIK